jgi:hypothetical protein
VDERAVGAQHPVEVVVLVARQHRDRAPGEQRADGPYLAGLRQHGAPGDAATDLEETQLGRGGEDHAAAV